MVFELLTAGRGGHRSIAQTAHPEGHDLLIVLVADHSLAPILVDLFGVGGIVPGAVVRILCPLLLGAHHRFLVRCPHHDAVLIRETRVLRIIRGKGVVPHGRPQVVRLEAQQKLKDLGIKLRIHPTEFFRRPAGEGGRLVIEEDASVLHRRLRLQMPAGSDDHGAVVWNADVRPPIPGRNTHLFGEIIGGVDGATLVCPDKNERARHSWKWPLYDRGHGSLPVAFDAGDVQLVAANQVVDQRAAADCAEEDGRGLARIG